MLKNYNYERKKVRLPEYGRHIQDMVEYLMTIEDREVRNRQARVVVGVMGNVNPALRDSVDFNRKLWDHLFIMSDFQLDVDSPYARPTRQDLVIKPSPMPYTQGRIMFKHYGKYVGRIIEKLCSEENVEARNAAIGSVARYMRTKSFEYNQEHPNNEVIIKDIKHMSTNRIELDEVAINNLRTEYKQHLSARPQKAQQRTTQRNNSKNAQQKGKARNQKK